MLRSRSPRGAEEDALAGATPAEANDAALFSGDGDAVSATATPLDLDALTRAFARTANDATNANELCVLTSFSEKRPGFVDGPPLGESLAAHGALVEGGAAPGCRVGAQKVDRRARGAPTAPGRSPGR